MKINLSGRQSGAALVTAAALTVFLMLIAGALSSLSLGGLRHVTRSDNWMQAFYVADSGAQVANALIRANGGHEDTGSPDMVETINGETAAVDIEDLGGGLFQITSDATVDGESTTVEVVLEISPLFELEAGIQVNVSNGVEMNVDQIPIRMVGTVDISGFDHAPDGTQLADQTGAVNGIGLNPVPGETVVEVDIDVSSTPTVDIVGDPDPVMNQAANVSTLLQNLRTEAQTNADVTVTGSTVMSSADTGTYGTAADPSLVYVNLGDNENLLLEGDFTGYGTLFVDVGRVEDLNIFKLTGTASWYGLVVIHFRDEVIASADTNLIEIFGNDNDIYGGLVTSFAGPSVDFTGNANLLMTNGIVEVLYSSELVGASPGVETVSDVSAKLASYRVR